MDTTNALRQRRYIARLKARAASAGDAAAEIARLKRQLAQAKARIQELTGDQAVKRRPKDKARRG